MLSETLDVSNGEAPLHADRCMAEIIHRIREGTLRPTQRLGEESFARKLGVGRPAVRVAFDRLVSMGVLNRIHRSGTFVRKLGLEQYCELSDVRAVLEAQAASLACQRATASDLRELTLLAEKMDLTEARLENSEDPNFSEMRRLETEFHGRIARLCGNEILRRLISMQDLVSCCFSMSVALSPAVPLDGTVPQHREVAKALASRNPELAAQVMRDHILLSKERTVSDLTGIAKGVTRGEFPISEEGEDPNTSTPHH